MFDRLNSGKVPEPRKGMPSPRLDEGEFKRRFRDQFPDSSFDGLASELDRIAHAERCILRTALQASNAMSFGFF
jgi:thiamine monophosphate kinase